MDYSVFVLIGILFVCFFMSNRCCTNPTNNILNEVLTDFYTNESIVVQRVLTNSTESIESDDLPKYEDIIVDRPPNYETIIDVD